MQKRGSVSRGLRNTTSQDSIRGQYRAPEATGARKMTVGAQLQLMQKVMVESNWVCAASSLLGLALQIVAVELNRDSGFDGSSDLVVALKLAVSALTVTSILFLVRFYREHYRAAKKTMVVLEGDSFVSSGYLYWLLAEIAILLVHSPVGLDFELNSSALSADDSRRGWRSISYHIDEVMCVAMMSRLYLLWRVLRDTLAISSESARSISMWYEEDLTNLLIIRSLLTQHPVSSVIGVVALVVPTSAYVLMLLERPADTAFENYFNSLWFVIVTVTTVGYGDIYAHSIGGRLYTMFLCCIAIGIISLGVSAIVQLMRMSQRQSKVVQLLEYSRLQSTLKRRAGKSIACAWRLYVEGSSQPASNIMDSAKLSKLLRDFRVLRKQMNAGMDQGSELLFKEMLSLRESSDIRFSSMEEKLTGMEKTLEELDTTINATMENASMRLAEAVRAIRDRTQS